MDEAKVDWEGIDLYGVGRGPGAFSGLRISTAVAQSFALPSGAPVYAVSSGEALARSVACEVREVDVIVVGDARRDRLWWNRYRPEGDGVEAGGEWSLGEAAELVDQWPEGAVVVSPDFDRLKHLVPASKTRWIEESRYPSAREVALLIKERVRLELPSEPLTPLYLHPPVFVEPRFL